MSEIQQDALPTAPEWLEAAVADELANTIALRRHFHAEPELGNQETKTRDYIAAELGSVRNSVSAKVFQGAAHSGCSSFSG